MLKKSAIQTPSPLKEKVVSVPELGGDVLVRGILLKDRLEASIAGRFGSLAAMLAACVFVNDDNGVPVLLYDAVEWERWGAKNYEAALALWEVTRELSDLDGKEAEKNLPAQSTDSPPP